MQSCAWRHVCNTAVIVALQLLAGGVVHRVFHQQPLCSPAALPATRVVALALLVPLSEELIYRGALLLVFTNRLAASPCACVALPALFFAAMHINSSHFEASKVIHHFAFGCCVGARALVSGSALHAAFIHVANNALVLCAHAEATSGGVSLAPATAAYSVCACVDLLLLSKRQHAASTCE
jgi:membrane protease YdiL (CAAX protease family)